jgi:hypothetical protein
MAASTSVGCPQTQDFGQAANGGCNELSPSFVRKVRALTQLLFGFCLQVGIPVTVSIDSGGKPNGVPG